MKFLALLAAAVPLLAHVGSPDIFFEGDAGPYRLLVTVRPPQVIPGVAEVDIRSLSPEAQKVRIVPLPVDGPAAELPPKPDVAQPAKGDPQFYNGTIWLMEHGSWKVRIDVEGARGPGRLEVPVPAVATRVMGMQKTIALALVPLGLLLALGIVSIAGASAREAPLAPGVSPDRARVRRSRIVMAVASLIVIGALWSGNAWWSDEAGGYLRYVFKPLQLESRIDRGNHLRLQLTDPGWLDRRTDDLLPDHGHLMHLYVMRMPAMDVVWHLHPEPSGEGAFEQALPSMPAGRYALYGDIVHADGLPETASAVVQWPEIQGEGPKGDDAGGALTPAADGVARLPDGYELVWLDRASPRAKQPNIFRFRLQDEAGRPASDMELYMGMPGHAAFVAEDGSVFAHIHPSGSVPMPALALVQPSNPHAGHMMHQAGIPAEVSFPYGFPKAGSYRIIVQVKRAGHVETALFPVGVEN